MKGGSKGLHLSTASCLKAFSVGELRLWPSVLVLQETIVKKGTQAREVFAMSNTTAKNALQ